TFPARLANEPLRDRYWPICDSQSAREEVRSQSEGRRRSCFGSPAVIFLAYARGAFHCSHNILSYSLVGLLQRICREMGVASRRLRLRVAKEFSNDRQGKAA